MNNRTFNSEGKTKIKEPFANKHMLCSRQLINRKYKQGTSFVPKNDEYRELLNNDKYNLQFEDDG